MRHLNTPCLFSRHICQDQAWLLGQAVVKTKTFLSREKIIRKNRFLVADGSLGPIIVLKSDHVALLNDLHSIHPYGIY